jgi:ABC-type uncharacterized transport system involved in gliding motility auxiliary subunit
MVQNEPKTVAFLWGHGEKRKDKELKSLRNRLERHYSVIEVREGHDGLLILDGVDVLVVPGPTSETPAAVRDRIDEFLTDGGKAMILVDSVLVDEGELSAEPNESGPATRLEAYGLHAGDDVVFDTRSNETLTFTSRFGSVALPYPYWVRAPTVESKVSGDVDSAVLPWAGSLEVVDAQDGSADLEVMPLLETTAFAAIDEDYRDVSPRSPRLANVSKGELGTRVLAAAVVGTRCPPRDTGCEKSEMGSFRLIVTTDSDWIAEPMAARFPDHLTLAENWVDWLAQEDALAAIRSKGPSRGQLLFTSETHRKVVQYANVLGVPGLVAVLGLVRYALRRRRTGRVYTVE